MKIPLLGGTGEEDFLSSSAQKCINWYPHKTRGRGGLNLNPTPGLTLFAGLVGNVIRGAIKFNDMYYVISGNTLYKVNEAGQETSIGTIDTSFGHVRMAQNGATNGKEILIVDGTRGYINSISTGTDVLTAIADASFPDTATHCQYIDGFFVVNDPSVTGKWFSSESYNGTTWDALDFATAERQPDKLQGLVVTNREIWLVGEDTSEVWANDGSGGFAFSPLESGYSQWGTNAPQSLAETSGVAFWLGRNSEGGGFVIMTKGLQPSIVSPPGIVSQITDLDVTDDAYGWTYQYKSHIFYVLTFPTEELTLVYDVTTQEWHEWASKETGYFRGSNHVFLYGKHLVGDSLSGKVYELDWGVGTEDGDLITRTRRSPWIHLEDKATIHRTVWLVLNSGASETSEEPTVILRFRDNDGDWSSWKERSCGLTGEKDKRLVWRQLGKSESRMYEVQTSAVTPLVLITAYLNASERDRLR